MQAAVKPALPTRTPVVAGLRRRWTLAFLVGEPVGFVPPAIAGATLATIGVSDPVLVVGLTIAGLFEGVALGVAQSWVLARHAPAVNGRAWVVATTTAAGFAWFVGMCGGALMGSDIAPAGLLFAVLVPEDCIHARATATLSGGPSQEPGSHERVSRGHGHPENSTGSRRIATSLPHTSADLGSVLPPSGRSASGRACGLTRWSRSPRPPCLADLFPVARIAWPQVAIGIG